MYWRLAQDGDSPALAAVSGDQIGDIGRQGEGCGADSRGVDLLQNSFDRLRQQIDARDDFLTRRGNFGLIAPARATAEIQ